VKLYRTITPSFITRSKYRMHSKSVNNKDCSETDAKIRIIQSDITTLTVDAIVNAANSLLLGGGGVDGGCFQHDDVQLYTQLLGGKSTS